jgi:hypothetical protein
MKFLGILHLEGKTATGIRVPPEVVAGLGHSKRPPVRVTINGYSYRSTIAPMGGDFWIPVSAENRNGAGVVAGQEVEVDVELDTAPRQVEVPPDFAEALAAAPAAKRFFEGLSYSQQRWFVLNIQDAKTPETRARRVAGAVQRLNEGRGQR